MHHICRRVARLSAVALLLAGCIRDQLDNVHQCQVVSPDNSWSSNGISMVVTSPVCPVIVDYSGNAIYFSARTRAPSNMPSGNLGISIIDLTGDLMTDLLGIFQPVSSTSTEALTTGFYSAGRDGIPLAPDRPVQDRGYAQFPVSLAFGGGIASAFALLPYKITNPPVSAAKVTPSNWTSPKVGVPTIVRVVPQVRENISPIAGFDWYFDGKIVLDSARSIDPRVPVSPGRQFTAKVFTRGTHRWKVTMRYGSYPNVYGTTITWNQTFY